MPLSRRVARFNQVVTNPVLGRVAPWMPGFGVVYHRGRTSGREYHTPVNVFPRDDGYLIALTYGSGSDWVKNVLAAQQCDLLTRGKRHHLVDPVLYSDATRADLPLPVRMFLSIPDVTEFLALKSA